MNNQEIIKDLFNRLKPVQQKMFLSFFGCKNTRKFIIHSSRRLGKTYLLCVIACCIALSGSNKQIRYATFTQKALMKMVQPIMKELWTAYPENKRPKYNSQDNVFTFPNGSQIHFAGVNNGRSDNLRGTAADLCLIDESGFIDELGYLTESVLLPQLINNADGKIIMASSSPLSPAHEFVHYINEAKINNSYQSYTIYEGEYLKDIIEEFCREAGGASSTTWRREYLNEIITDEKLAIIPEWDSKKYVHEVNHDDFYKYYHKYESLDTGVRDKTACLFGYYDFKQARLIVEDEFTIQGQEVTTKKISENIKEKESTLDYEKLYRRVADSNNLILIQDLNSEYNLNFYPTNKDTLAAMVNEVRLWVQANRIIIHPRCKELIACLEFGVFSNDKRAEFGRSKALGHYDALAALIYLVRNIDTYSNPISESHGITNDMWVPPNSEQIQRNEDLKKIFNLK